MNMNFALLNHLRTSTQDLHQEVEAKMNFLDPAMTEDDYFGKLARLHAWSRGLEARRPLDATWDPELILRIAWLSEDLKGRDPVDAIDHGKFDASGWWGACYVIEGSSLGGQVMCRQLGQRLPTRYFAGRGAETGPRWMSFLAALRDAEPGLDGSAVGEGAVRAFRNLMR